MPKRTAKRQVKQAPDDELAPIVGDWIKAFGEEQVLQTWNAVSSEQAYLEYEPLEAMGGLHEANTKVVMGLGGNRSGKSYTTFFDFMGHCTGVWPYSLAHKFDPDWKPIKAWVITRDYPLLREAIDEYFQEFLPQHWIHSWNTNQHILTLNNVRQDVSGDVGSKISFKSADAGPRKMESAAVDLVFVDEEIDQAVWNAILTRTISKRGRMYLAMTPDNGFSWTYESLYRKFYAEDKAVRARTREWLTIVEATMYDNPYLDRDEIRLIEDMYDDDIVREVRLMGHYAEITGEMVFNATAVTKMRAKEENPLRRVNSTDYYEEYDVDGVYVLGADIASGVANGDYSVGVVFNKRTSRVAAVLRERVQPDEFALHLIRLAKEYGSPLVAVERQNHGTSTLITMRERGYFNLYCHSSEDRVAWSTPSDKLGWDTNPRTKDEMIDNLRSLIGTRERDPAIDVPSATVLSELGSFVYYTDKIPDRSPHKLVGRCGAKYGAHDDTVIALAIACQVAKRRYLPSLSPSLTPAEDREGTLANLRKQVDTEWEEQQGGEPLSVGSYELEV